MLLSSDVRLFQQQMDRMNKANAALAAQEVQQYESEAEALRTWCN